MSRWIRVVLLAGVAASAILGLTVDLVSDGLTREVLLFSGVGLLIYALAAFLVVRVPENRLSWTLLAVSLGLSLGGLFELGGAIGEWLTLIGLFGLLLPGIGVFVPLWFPTGTPLSSRWRWVGWVTAAGVVAIVVGSVVEQILGEGAVQDIETCTAFSSCTVAVGLGAVLAAIPAAIASLVIRWVRSDGIERQQMKWLIPTLMIFGLGVIIEFAVYQDSLIGTTLLNLGLLLIPVSIAVAVLKYRLYEVDRIISRTLTYAVVVAVLGAVYFGTVTLVTSLLPSQNALAVAGSTLAVAALFNPLRKRIQRAVDRRFNRSSYQAEVISEQFAAKLQELLTVEDLAEVWNQTVSHALQPGAIGIWLNQTYTTPSTEHPPRT